MKRFTLFVALCLILSPACLAEESNTDKFLSGLSETWGAFLGMAKDAGQGISNWMQESGVTGWIEGAADGAATWAQESGLADWAEGAMEDIAAWFDETGISQWTADAAQNIQSFIEENGPAIEAWLSGAGQEVRAAWDALVNPDGHTAQELEEAYETVTESLGEIAEDGKTE